MKWIPAVPMYLTFLVVLAGCTAPGAGSDSDQLLGRREQKAVLAKARPLQEFALTPSFPYGNSMLHLGGALLQPDQVADCTFRPGELPVIAMQGSGLRGSLSVMIDPSANASWMQYSAAERNQAVFLSNNGQVIPYLGTANTDGASTYAAVIPRLQIDGITLDTVPLYVRMARGRMKPVVYRSTPQRVDAVLGFDNLRQFEYIRVNLREGRIRFSTSTAFMPDEERLIGSAAISTVCLDKLAVSGSIFGQPVPIVLDFAGDFAFARGDRREPLTKQIELGEVVFLDVPTEVLAIQDRYPRAGARLLERYVVTVCPRAGTVYFERP